MGTDPLLTIDEVSVWLRIKVSTLRKWVCYQKIPYLKVGRCVFFDRQVVEQWVLGNNPQNAKWDAVDAVGKGRYNDAVR